jgi:hypothetical protein
MSGPEAIAIAVVLPVLLVALAEMYKRHVAFKERKLELVASEATEQVKQLEQRMRVLERIATDKGVDVAQQIESLRDEPAFANKEGN